MQYFRHGRTSTDPYVRASYNVHITFDARAHEPISTSSSGAWVICAVSVIFDVLIAEMGSH